MVIKLGINEWPMPGRLVKKATYESEYHKLTLKDGAPFVPYAVWKDLFFAAFILLAVAACAAYFSPFGPSFRPSHACAVSCGIGLLPRLVASLACDSEGDFALAACRFHEWDVCTLDCLGFAPATTSP